MRKRIAALVAATLIATIPLTSANAGDRDDDAIAIGVIGLAAGLIAGHAISGSDVHFVPNHDRYDRRYDHRRHVRYVRHAEPWTEEWYSYCSQTYRSFNPRTGTYIGYDGRRHFCTAPATPLKRHHYRRH